AEIEGNSPAGVTCHSHAAGRPMASITTAEASNWAFSGETPRSWSRVIAKEDPTVCREAVAKTSHQPTMRIAAWSEKTDQRPDTSARITAVNVAVRPRLISR